jgi:hypothetical protein
MFTKAFWIGAAERAVKTFLQTFVAVAIAGVGADAVGITAGLQDVSWLAALSVAALATILSLATSAGNASFTEGRTVQAATGDAPTVVINGAYDPDAVATQIAEARHRAER